MLENMQICRTPGMASEKERIRNIGGPKISGNSRKEGNHEPIEDQVIIDQAVESSIVQFHMSVA
jgi:hypothetical protein